MTWFYYPYTNEMKKNDFNVYSFRLLMFSVCIKLMKRDSQWNLPDINLV